MRDLISEERIGEFDTAMPGIYCLDHGFVKLIDCMPRLVPDDEESADHAIAEAARCSYQRGTKTIADDKTLIRYLMRHNHTSPLEMVEFKFHCKMPMFVARQWVRHRTASINELSGRYSEMPEEYYVPGELRVQSLTNTQGSEGSLSEADTQMTKGLMRLQSQDAFKFYARLLEKGIAREQARIGLPLSTYTEWYWKRDLEDLLHFLDLRCHHPSQKEIQVYGNALLSLIKPIVPWTIDAWEDYSPYRGGMVLTRFEVHKLKDLINSLAVIVPSDGSTPTTRSIDTGNKLENKEWLTKATELGLTHGYFIRGEK